MQRRHGQRRSARTLALAALTICWIGSGRAWAQDAFIDDAQRRVALPSHVTRVFAAGAPAEVLLYTLAPNMLVARNHMPPAPALELMPPAYRAPTPIRNLPRRDDPRYDAELLALRPDVYVDYGTVDADYVAALEAISGSTGIPAIILDGRLTNVPAVYRRLGAALGVPERGERLGAEAQRIIDKYRGAAPAIRVYLACSQDSLTPCVQGHGSGEIAELLGAANTAGTTATAPRRPLTVEEIRAWKPDAIIAASKASADALRSDPAWREVSAVAAGRVYFAPDLPFSWGPRPPSVNRLFGLIWMAYVLRAQPFDDDFFDDVRGAFAAFYHITPTMEQLERLVAR